MNTKSLAVGVPPTSRAAQLIAALRKHASGRHVVVIRGTPDPDSLASAWAHAQLVSTLGIGCDIVHLPVVSRVENRAMVNILELPLMRIGRADDLDRYAALSLVDANVVELPARPDLPCVSIVDHHGVTGRLSADFVDVRVEIGATSSIYTEYLVEGAPELLDATSRGSRLATALTYGIRSDTDDMLRATAADFHALAALAPVVDREVLAQLARYSIAAPAMRVLRRALWSMRIHGTSALAGVGHVRPQDRDAIGQAADFIVRREGLKTAIVYGIVGDHIDGSLRTSDATIDPASWLREAFGLSPLGLPYGGGRRGKGGFQLPLGPLGACPDRKLLWEATREMVNKTIITALGPTETQERAEDHIARFKSAPAPAPAATKQRRAS